jgi:hypothetical protein
MLLLTGASIWLSLRTMPLQVGYLPLHVMLFVYLCVGIGGALYYYNFGTMNIGVSALIPMSDLDIDNTLVFWLVAICALSIGGVCSWLTLKSAGLPLLDPRVNVLSKQLFSSELAMAVAVSLSLITSVLIVFGVGLGNYLNSPDYLTIENPGLRTIASVTTPAASFLVGYAAGATSSRTNRLICWGLLLLLILVTAGTASRIGGFIPICASLGFLAASRPKTKVAIRLLFVATVATLLLVSVALYLRDQAQHGLFPYAEAMFALANPTTTTGFSFVEALDSLVCNALFGFPSSFMTIVNEPSGLPAHVIATGLTPLPGFMTNWENVWPDLRINIFTPYSMVGEIFSLGVAATAIFFFVLGAAMHTIGSAINWVCHKGGSLLGIAVVGILVLFVVTSTQYYLRTSTRLLYSSIALLLAALAYLATRKRKQVSVPYSVQR